MATSPDAREELLVVKADDRFLCARPSGDVTPHPTSGEGFYARDTRHLSELTVSFGDAEPVALSRSVESGHRATVDATNPPLSGLPRETVRLRRTLLMAERLWCSLALQSFHTEPADVPLTLWLAADFADIFEVRGERFDRPRQDPPPPEAIAGRVRFARAGADGEELTTVVELDPPPAGVAVEGNRVRCEWRLTLGHGEATEIRVAAAAGDAGLPAPELARSAARMDERQREFAADCASIRVDGELLQRTLDASLRDLDALMTVTADGPIPAAGIPWYVAPFGRDSLITAYESLILNPRIARDTLRVLAARQAVADDPWRDAEPGKILHELRSGELARVGLIPHTPYYGTVDATPLFLMLAAAYHRWTGDTDTLATLRPSLDAAIGWIDDHGDADGDGFVEYHRRSPGGLRNQCWKDHDGSIVHADGSIAEGPIAAVEAQAYVYAAKRGIADVYEVLGERDRARALRAEAARLRKLFDEAFWMPGEDCYALALDGAKRQVASVTSNPGHALFCGIVGDARAPALIDRLMAADMFNGWGVRTLSSESPAYNPMSYHNGSVWPHDSAIVAAGLRRYGRDGDAARIAEGLLDAAAGARDGRLAELYCGFDRLPGEAVVGYPVACVPQAWAAAAPFLLLQTMLGIDVDGRDHTVAATRPLLPTGIDEVVLGGVAAGGSRVDLRFERGVGETARPEISYR